MLINFYWLNYQHSYYQLINFIFFKNIISNKYYKIITLKYISSIISTKNNSGFGWTFPVKLKNYKKYYF